MDKITRNPREAAEETIKRAAAADTDPLTLLDTEDALSAIPDDELLRSVGVER
jgi:hypothetical protein